MENNYEILLENIVATAEACQTQLSAAALKMIAKDLEEHDLKQVLDALKRCRREIKPRQFCLAAVIERIEDGYLSADEAWARLPMTEADTAVWTGEMTQAWGMVLGLIESGDMTAARMAFRSAYERLVGESRRAGKRPVWSATLGHDRHGRETALSNAVLRGYLTASRAAQLVEPDVAQRLLALKLPGTALQ